ncbi:MAG: HIT domain-containing protein [Candidatus Cloacimonetes bacterium]|nr:HIT domain-containing protein [Candidatus Cloacimonadota bacterium]
MTDILYSPWRLQYILAKKGKECILCLTHDSSADDQHLILYRGTESYVIMNTFPYNNGHIMAVPYRHVGRLNDLAGNEFVDLFNTVCLCEKILEKVYHPDGINIGMNLGRSAGAGIDQHLHVHIIPRWQGDVNFMTTVAGTRIIPEAFERTYKLLKEQFDNEKAEK